MARYKFARRYPPHFHRLVIGRTPNPDPADARKAAAKALALVAADPKAMLFLVMPSRRGAPPDNRELMDMPELVHQFRAFDRELVRLDPVGAARLLERHVFPEQAAHIAACRNTAVTLDHEGDGRALAVGSF